MRLLLSTYGSRKDVDRMVRLAAQLRAEEYDAPLAIGMLPAGGGDD